MQLDYQFDDAAIQAAFKRVQKLGRDTTPITRAIAAVLASESEEAFAQEADPTTGNPWKPLTKKYKARLAKKGKTGRMLQRSQGGLAMSLSTEYDAVSAAIGANKVYAAIHQWGGLPDMPPGPAAVPARPYMGLSAQGAADIIDIINTQHAAALKAR
ncbi:phage virion morphogenesis protein [Photorhabdus heterorhabditis]|uniref:phage virion morphogenesis protein n=1 Tax=Photorhabdus heterorhabditis TaxID=880156 RepID=UPI0015628E3F|nr:phage virion morphogenesis protein [Photorhabdus heterorhabditis]NRN26743.1 phage virion morphogenesis protein [Photorhabdus heterorhabditis subsp. aluminescens]